MIFTELINSDNENQSRSVSVVKKKITNIDDSSDAENQNAPQTRPFKLDAIMYEGGQSDKNKFDPQQYIKAQ